MELPVASAPFDTITEAHTDLPKVGTSCQDCVFAVYAGDTQTDCDHGRTEKYDRLGLLIKAENEGGKFFLIDGRKCSYARSKDWKKDLALHERVAAVKEEAKVSVTAIVVCQDWPDADWQSALDFTLFGVFRSGFKEIILVTNQDQVQPPDLLAHFRAACEGKPVTWRFNRILGKEDDGSRRPIGAVIDETFKHVQSQFYTVLVPGQFVTDTPAALELAINRDLKQVLGVVPPEGLHGLTVHRVAHKFLGGHAELEFTDDAGAKDYVADIGAKLKRLAADYEAPDMVLDSISPYLPCGCE